MVARVRIARKLRWPRFGLRTAFVFLTVCCVVLGGVTYRLQQTRAERRAVSELQQLGGEVIYDYGLLSEVRSTRFERLLGLFAPLVGRVSHVTLDGRPVTAKDLRLLEAFPYMTGLNLSRSVGDDDLRILERLPQLEMLSLSGSRITDRGLVHVKRLRKLHSLFLRRTYITDDGLKHLEDLPVLWGLAVDETTLTDGAIDSLLRIPQLASVSGGWTEMSDAGIARLKAKGVRADITSAITAFEQDSYPQIVCRVRLPSGKTVVAADDIFSIGWTAAGGTRTYKSMSGRLSAYMLALHKVEPVPIIVSATLGKLKSKPVPVDLSQPGPRPARITLEMQ